MKQTAINVILVTLIFVIALLLCSKGHSQDASQDPLQHTPVNGDVLPSMSDSDRHIKSLVGDVLAAVDQHYVYPEVAKAIRQHVAAAISAGQYRSALSVEELIERLQTDLREASKDNHFSLHLAKGRADREPHILASTPADQAVEVDVLTSDIPNSAHKHKTNIGYLRFDKFSGGSATKARIKLAMQSLMTTDSLIIDLRENGGGDPNLVTFLMSYFVDKNTHLWSVFDRSGRSIFEANSVAQTPRYTAPLCILTSHKTYSAAEAFTYTLKHLGRACVVGEATGGGAHLVQMKRANDDIDIRVPVARAYNPITQTNWERIGVTPTLAADASNAKSAAISYLKGL